ncbi:MAG: hypothetical protein IIA66_03775 [Planctomycetes bacterium]|nr:hypothetical protein [Planctomycetota bacterium]
MWKHSVLAVTKVVAVETQVTLGCRVRRRRPMDKPLPNSRGGESMALTTACFQTRVARGDGCMF